MEMVTGRFEVYLVSSDPTIGSEIKKTRPCVIISPDELNNNLDTLIIAPLTSAKKYYPTRINCKFKNKSGQVVLDQIRTIDKQRLIKKLGEINQETQDKMLEILNKIFSK